MVSQMAHIFYCSLGQVRPRLALRIQEHILRLEIPVNDTMLVKVLQRQKHLLTNQTSARQERSQHAKERGPTMQRAQVTCYQVKKPGSNTTRIRGGWRFALWYRRRKTQVGKAERGFGFQQRYSATLLEIIFTKRRHLVGRCRGISEEGHMCSTKVHLRKEKRGAKSRSNFKSIYQIIPLRRKTVPSLCVCCGASSSAGTDLRRS